MRATLTLHPWYCCYQSLLPCDAACGILSKNPVTCTCAMLEGDANCPKVKILETVEALTGMLDVAEPWDIVIFDPSGVSEISPEADVSIERYDPAAE
jgi:hypothetical protein